MKTSQAPHQEMEIKIRKVVDGCKKQHYTRPYCFTGVLLRPLHLLSQPQQPAAPSLSVSVREGPRTGTAAHVLTCMSLFAFFVI